VKTCRVCRKRKARTSFYLAKRNSDGLEGICIKCKKGYFVAWQQANAGKVRAYCRKSYRSNIKHFLLASAKRRAKRKGVPFSITLSDIHIPNTCPVLGIAMNIAEGYVKDSSPSIDKVFPWLGYVPGNVEIISHRANRLKSDGTAEEHAKIAKYIAGFSNE
jgi:hypothetical protein